MSDNEFQSPLPPRPVNLGGPEKTDDDTATETRPPENQSETPTGQVIPETNPQRVNINTASTSPKVGPKTVNKKLFFILGGVALAVILALGGWMLLKPKDSVGNKVVTLNYWGLWEDSQLLEGVFADFEAKNPGIKVNYKKNQKTDYRSRLQGRLAKTATEEEVPDIFRIHATWLPMFSGQLASVPADSVSRLDLDKDFYNVFKTDLKVGGKYMAIPLMYDSLQLFYNKDIIEAAQVKLPKSWWDLQETAKLLTVKDKDGRITRAGLAAGMVDNVDHWSDILGLLIKQNGGDILQSSPENDGNIRDAIIYYTNFRTLHKVWNESLPPSTEMFANGNLAFYFAPSWRVFDIETINPGLKFEIINVPQLPTLKDVPKDQAYASANLTNINWATYWVEAVNSKSPKQKEAWKLLEYLASKEGLEKMFATQSQTRSFGEIYPRISLADQIADNPKISPFISVANNSESGYLSSRTFDDGLNDQMNKYFTDAVNGIVAPGTETEKIMVTLRSGINQLVTKYEIKP